MLSTKEQQLMKKFGKHLAKIRKSKGYTQQELAEEVNMSIVAIAYIETGKRWARLGTLHKIANALNVTISDLLKGI
jgi:transcriptional regulator with XRE-family HTH domain